MSQNTEHNVRTWDDHADNACIAHLAGLMREKMKFSREVKGRSGWQDMPVEVLSVMLREHVEKGDPVDVANFCMMLAAKRAPIAEARGAAEERAKGAEGQEPVAFQILHHATWREAVPANEAYWTSIGYKVRRLYTRPANVAALESRVKELEEVLSHLLETEEVTDPSKPRVLDLAYTAFMSGCCGKNPDDGGKCDWFTDTRPQIMRHIEKARAALTREGGV